MGVAQYTFRVKTILCDKFTGIYQSWVSENYVIQKFYDSDKIACANRDLICDVLGCIQLVWFIIV